MKKFYFLFVGYNTIEETKLCRFLTAFHLPFHYAAVQNVAEAQSFLLEHKVDFIISHPQTTEFMNFIDLIKQNTAIGIIKPFFATDLLSRSKLEIEILMVRMEQFTMKLELSDTPDWKYILLHDALSSVVSKFH